MKLVNLVFLSFVLLFSSSANGQYPANPSPEQNRQIEQQQQRQERQRQAEALFRLKNIASRRPIMKRNGNELVIVHGQPPKPTERDRQAIAVDEDLTASYGEFLKQKNTGIVRLQDAAVCPADKRLVNAAAVCPDAYPDKATSFSFRNGDYQWKIFSDISLEDSKLHVKGVHLLGILSALGNQSLDDLNLSSAGVKQLSELEAPRKMEDYDKYSKLIANGVKVENHIFSNKAHLIVGQTYLLRAVAFDGSFNSRRDKNRRAKIWGNDKRDNVIVVFTAVRKHEDRSWIILWKELARKTAPKIDF